MKSRPIAADTKAQVHVVILDSGEEAFTALTRFANESGISAASLTAIGAFERGDRRLVRYRLEELPQNRSQ